MWYLIIVQITCGLVFGEDTKIYNYEMNNQLACEKAARTFIENSSKHIGTVCLSKNTGQLIEFKK